MMEDKFKQLELADKLDEADKRRASEVRRILHRSLKVKELKITPGATGGKVLCPLIGIKRVVKYSCTDEGGCCYARAVTPEVVRCGYEDRPAVFGEKR